MLERLHNSGEMTRSQLADQTGLNRSTIRDLIGELTGLGLVVEDRGSATVGPGRPSWVARVQPTGAVALAVELEVDSVSVATVGLGGHIFEKSSMPNPAGQQSPAEVVARLGALAGPLLAGLPRNSNVAGIGVAVAGVVRRQDGFVHVSPNLGWSNVPLAGMISSGLGFDRVMMANEADLSALAEYRRTTAGQKRHMIFIAGEVGVGIGIIYDGKPMLGAAGYAGEAGHTIVNPEGRECRCGAIGCWETEVGEEALAKLIGHPVDAPRQELVAEVVRRAHAGEPEVFTALGHLGRWLGIGIGNLINTFNPELVVVGGFFQQLYPFLERSVVEAAQETALNAPWLSCSIRRSELGPDSTLIGASELVFAEVIGNPGGFTSPASAVDPVVTS
ncbi:MAG TPA: ROK family transcriptional regulator [Acidimicrobiia bacterium]|nr:ROK family transcriptional regulator [Acidimicrobiia bacterium]